MRSVSWALGLALLVSACGTSTPPELSASATTQRADEGFSRMSVAIRNEGSAPVAVERARLAWKGMDGDWIRLTREIRADDALAFKATYRPGVCEPLGASPRLQVEVDGETVSVPLRVHPDLVLQSIHDRQCSLAALESNATVALAPGTVVGRELRTAIVVDRVAGSTDRVRVVDVGGSVLLRMGFRQPQPAEGAPLSGDSARIPVTISPTPRCDPHAQSQSSQTFLLSAYLEIGEGDQTQDVRTILPLTSAAKADLQGLISRYCR